MEQTVLNNPGVKSRQNSSWSPRRGTLNERVLYPVREFTIGVTTVIVCTEKIQIGPTLQPALLWVI